MKRELLSKAFGEIDESYIIEAYRPVSEDGSRSPAKNAFMEKNCVIILALAVAIILALGIVGYAWSHSCF